MHTTCKTGFDVYTRMNTRYVVIRTGKSSDTFAVVAVDAVDARAVVLARIRQTFVHVDLAHFAWKDREKDMNMINLFIQQLKFCSLIHLKMGHLRPLFSFIFGLFKQYNFYKLMRKNCLLVWEPWSSGYWRRLMLWRSSVWIPEPYNRWTFFTYICCK